MAYVRNFENIKQQSFKTGKGIANVTPSEDICITGIAGCFPNCRNVSEFLEGLRQKSDLFSDVSKSWKVVHPNIPPRMGKVNNLEKFDASYFGIHYHQAEAMDPGCRKLLELSIEAVIDAGVNPIDLRGTNTGVFISTGFRESEMECFYGNLSSPNFGITGCTNSAIAQRISYHLGLQGPSVSIDAACSGSMYALQDAFQAIKTGRCDGALVGGVNLILNCNITMQHLHMGIIDKDGRCGVFDEDANGFVRAEAIPIIFLQRMKNANRVYAKVVHVKTNCDGFKEENIFFPSKEMQQNLLWEVYQEVDIDPVNVNYVEAHSAGTKAGEPQEMAALTDVYCTNRTSSLLVGSVKSNMGHSEGSSGLCSIIKVILGMQNDCILPNVTYKTLRKDIDAFHNGKIAVVTDVTPIATDHSEYVGVNNSGIGGTNGHVILKRYNPQTSHKSLALNNRSRLICVSGRTNTSLTKMINSIRINCQNDDYLTLLEGVFKNSIVGHVHRGYAIVSNSTIGHQSSKSFSGNKPHLCVIFSEYSGEWMQMCTSFCEIPLFFSFIQKIQKVVSLKGINILEIIKSDVAIDDDMALVGSVVFQIALVDTLKFLEIPINATAGYSSGLISSAYAKNTISLEEAILIACQLSSWFAESSVKQYTSYPNFESSRFNITGAQKESDQLKILQLIVDQSPQFLTGTNCKQAGGLTEYMEYLLNCVMSPTSIDKLKKNLSEEHVVLVIGPDCTKVTSPLNLHLKMHECFLYTVGQLYEHGFNPNLEKLSHKLLWPVKAPSISPLIKWKHDDDWFLHDYKSNLPCGTGVFHISLDGSAAIWNYLTGHNIDGRILFPATGYLYIVWETFSKMLGRLLSDTKVVFENVKFLRPAIILKQTILQLTVHVNRISKKFEVRDLDFLLVKGKIGTPNKCDCLVHLPLPFVTETTIGTKDIYKILHLKNYNYEGAFCDLEKINLTGTCATNRWKGNWITFMDNMLQMKLIQETYCKNLLPIGIERLIIDPQMHLEDVTRSNGKILTYSYKQCNIIKSRGIEIRNVLTSPFLARNMERPPVFQTYKFMTFCGAFSTEIAIRLNIQIVLENMDGCYFRVIEIVEEDTQKVEDLLAPIVYEILMDEPYVKSQIVVFSSTSLDIPNITVENKTIDALQDDCNLVIISKGLRRPQVLACLLNKLHDGAFFVSKEEMYTAKYLSKNVRNLEIISVYETNKEEFVLLRKVAKYTKPMIIQLNTLDNSFKWMPILQNALSTTSQVLLLAENQSLSGILGFVNCLKRELGSQNVSCLFIMDDGREFNENDDFYTNQIRKGLTINVLKDGEWGTYRHLPLNKEQFEECEHAVGTVTKGSISSFHWQQGPFSENNLILADHNFAKVYYVGLNFRDVIAASGTINLNSEMDSKGSEMYSLGLEFAGRNSTGERVMGMVRGAALSNLVAIDPFMTWTIPNEWSMEGAATVPIVYSTVLYSLITIAKIQPNQTILIHAGAGGIGQAAINIALYFKCTIFTTVGSSEKRNFLKSSYITLKDEHIGNSRDISFEQIIMNGTRGKGVDIIINALSNEKLSTGLRCLAAGGTFIEIGRSDAYNNNSMEYGVFRKGRSFSAIHLDRIIDVKSSSKENLLFLVSQGIKLGYVKPLIRTVYDKSKVKEALRFMGEGKNIGKVLIKIKAEETNTGLIRSPYKFQAKPKFYCKSEKVYVIIGGLGGFGLELTDWLISRGAKKVTLVSRKNVTTDYQRFKINKWNYNGIMICVSQKDVSTQKECAEFLSDVSMLGEVDGIFNLATILQDALFENQSRESFTALLLAKVEITKNLDIVSREMCPSLRYFVTFSSLSCGRGNAGQTNYGMANSIMERICEKRKKDGYPGLAIQWGPIGEVGILANMEANKTIAGIEQQKISSCLAAMDVFLTQPEVVVSSMVVADKSGSTSNSVDLDDFMKEVSHILGITKIEHVNLHSTLAELGLNSISNVELRQFLSIYFQSPIIPRVLRNMTLFKLKEKAKEQKQ